MKVQVAPSLAVLPRRFVLWWTLLKIGRGSKHIQRRNTYSVSEVICTSALAYFVFDPIYMSLWYGVVIRFVVSLVLQGI